MSANISDTARPQRPWLSTLAPAPAATRAASPPRDQPVPRLPRRSGSAAGDRLGQPARPAASHVPPQVHGPFLPFQTAAQRLSVSESASLSACRCLRAALVSCQGTSQRVPGAGAEPTAGNKSRRRPSGARPLGRQPHPPRPPPGSQPSPFRLLRGPSASFRRRRRRRCGRRRRRRRRPPGSVHIAGGGQRRRGRRARPHRGVHAGRRGGQKRRWRGRGRRLRAGRMGRRSDGGGLATRGGRRRSRSTDWRRRRRRKRGRVVAAAVGDGDAQPQPRPGQWAGRDSEFSGLLPTDNTGTVDGWPRPSCIAGPGRLLAHTSRLSRHGGVL